MYAYTYRHSPILISIFNSISIYVCLPIIYLSTSIYISISIPIYRSSIYGVMPLPTILIQYQKAHSSIFTSHICNSLLPQWRMWIPLSSIHLLICDPSNASNLLSPRDHSLAIATLIPTAEAHPPWLGSITVLCLPLPSLQVEPAPHRPGFSTSLQAAATTVVNTAALCILLWHPVLMWNALPTLTLMPTLLHLTQCFWLKLWKAGTQADRKMIGRLILSF